MKEGLLHTSQFTSKFYRHLVLYELFLPGFWAFSIWREHIIFIYLISSPKIFLKLVLASDLLVLPDVCIIILFYSVPLVVWWQNYPFWELQILEHCGNSKQPRFVEVTISNPCMLAYCIVIGKVGTVSSIYEIKQRMMDNWSKNNQQTHLSCFI